MSNDQKTEELIKDLKESINKSKDNEMNAYIVRIPLLCKSVLDIHEILKDVKDGQEKLQQKIDDKFVTKEGEFWVVKSVVYAGAGIILASVLSTLVYLVLNH